LLTISSLSAESMPAFDMRAKIKLPAAMMGICVCVCVCVEREREREREREEKRERERVCRQHTLAECVSVKTYLLIQPKRRKDMARKAC